MFVVIWVAPPLEVGDRVVYCHPWKLFVIPNKGELFVIPNKGEESSPLVIGGNNDVNTDVVDVDDGLC